MRPISLTLQGFRSYRERVTFDWEGRGLVAVVGPTGSGKSSILDAIAFALYGKTPRIERDTKSLINQLSDIAQVELIFEAGGQRWKATRAIKRKGASGHALKRLDDGQEVDEGGLERDVNARIQELLGLDFKAFCRSVLLAQNQFAEFLTATPAKRDEVLKGVFGYDHVDKMRDAARRHLAAIEGELSAIDVQRQEAAAAAQALAAATELADAKAKRAAALEAAGPGIRDLIARGAAARTALETADAALAALDGVAAGLPDPDEAETLLVRAEETAGALTEATAAADDAAAARRRAEAAVAEAEEAAGGPGVLERATELLATLEAQDAARVAGGQRLEALRAAQAEAVAAVDAAQTSAEAAETARHAAVAAAAEAAGALEAAESALLQAQHAEMAATLRADLEEGGTCPVCDQPVHELPGAARAPKVAAATKAADKARKALTKATTQREVAGAAAEGAARDLESARREQVRLERDVAAAEDAETAEAARAQGIREELTGILGSEDPRAELKARRQRLEDARAQARLASTQAEAAADVLARARTSGDQARAGIRDLTRGLVAAATRLGLEAASGEEPADLRAGLATVATAMTAARERADAERVEAESAVEEAVTALATALADAELAPDDDFDAHLLEARGQAAEAAARVEVLEGQVAAAATIDERAAAAVARREVLERLASDLTPARFLNHLLAGERAVLADLGSDHLETLTEGRYRFTDDGGFDILDRNAADAHRRPDSLSGGETFLASLALALALAEMVGRSGGRLDAFFIDEGFGSLDPDHLDRAMDGVERLIDEAPHRLVVLVSHVPGVQERVDDLVVLANAPVTGETEVVRGAGAA